MPLSRSDLAFVRALVEEESGAVLDEDKDYLIEARLEPLARKQGLDSIAEWIAALRERPPEEARRQLVEALLNTETSFFRDFQLFEEIRTRALPELIRLRQSEAALTIWSAGCASGQEPYSVAMLLQQHFPDLRRWNVRIIAADLSEEALSRARTGEYTPFEVNRGLPAHLLANCFEKRDAAWRVRTEIRRRVEFHRLNLIRPWPALPPPDLILLRYVLIYFAPPTRQTVLGKVARVLKPGGYLFLGGPETLTAADPSLERVTFEKCAGYRRRGT